MALPKLKKQPHYPIYLHSLKRQVFYRPYTTADEKIIMMVQSSKDPVFVAQNLKQVIQNCIVDEDVDVKNLFSYDIELLMIKIRAKSAGEIVPITYKDKNTGKTVKIEMDLEQAEVEFSEDHKYVIEIAEGISFKMRDLDFEKLLQYQSLKTEGISDAERVDVVYSSALDCVEAIVTEDEVYKIGEETTKEELNEFVMELAGVSGKLFKFVETMPTITYKAKLPDGTELVVKNIRDFLD